MDFVKKMFATIFSTEFLVKILLIAAIFAVLNYLDRGFRIDLNHDMSIRYGVLELTIKEKN